MSDLNLTTSAVVCVHGGQVPDAKWLVRLAQTLPANSAVCLFGPCAGAVETPVTWQRMPTVTAGSTSTLLIAAHKAFSNSNLILLHTTTSLPDFWYQRLLRALSLPDVLAVSPLDNCDPNRAPLPAGVSSDASATEIDAACFVYSRRMVWDCAAISPLLSAWSAARLRGIALDQFNDTTPATLAPLRAVLLDHLYVAEGSRKLRGPEPTRPGADPRPPSPLGELRERVAARIANHPALPEKTPFPGLDKKPVVLHILHGWGGGAERFVRDLAAIDSVRTHLILIARGQFATRCYGERLELFNGDFRNPPLRQLTLPQAIADTALHDANYRAFLETIQQDFCVDAIAVSSLIGHSLDALRTGLPTLVIGHDYYPLWPLLHRDFGDRQLTFDAAQLAADLAAADFGFEFAQRQPSHWQALREAYVDALLTARATLISPSQSALTNLLHLEPRFAALPSQSIPHGLTPWPSGTVLPITPPSARPRLRLLLAGRIRGGKGAQLLRAALPGLREHADIFLLGAGSEGEQFFGEDGVNIVLNYAREQLPELVAHIGPDIALLLPTVSETFSYMLSELWSLGLPVLGTRLGSLAERIVEGTNGWLVEPEVSAIVAAVARLAQAHDAVASVRAQVCAQPSISIETMLVGYHALLPRVARESAAYPVHLPTPLRIELATLNAEYGQALRSLKLQLNKFAEQQRELDKRTDWALGLERQLHQSQQELTNAQTQWNDWKLQIQTDLDDRIKRVSALQAELEDRTQWALRLNDETARQREQITALSNEYETLNRDRDALLTSTSWRITAPLRSIIRRYRHLHAYLKFSWARLRSASSRVRSSIARRGAMATFKRIAMELRRTPVPAPGPIAQAAPTEVFRPFCVPLSATPRVSIVIPVYNKFAYTNACLNSLVEHAGEVAFEVIVVDDGSSDETPQRLQTITGVRTIRNSQNLGFVGSCNAGAVQAKGEFILFLNNDTTVTAGWLEALLRCFDQEPNAGLVGAKLVYPDGRLQEAGGIIFSDGSGWNYGRFDDPADPRYNFRREVDYCSGAAIMIRRTLFTQLGGFDTRYAPAYYEDTDLAFAVRSAGLKVIYEPAATVVHFEGITSGTDTGSGIKRFQVVNQGKFLDKWKEPLTHQPKPGTSPELARNHRACGRVLIIDAYTPTPDQDSGSLRMVNLMRVLRELGYAVSFLPENCAYMPRYSTDLQALGIEVLYHPHVHPMAWFQQYGATLNAIILSRHYVAANFIGLARLYAPQAKLIFDTVDLHYLREQRAAELENRDDLKRIAATTRNAELKIMRECDLTLVVSVTEQALLKQEQPQTRVEILSNVHEVYGCRRSFSQRRNLVFIGGFQHPPNVDAVQFFVREVFPKVRSQLPDIEFHVIGSKTPEEILALNGNGVVVHGFVEDIVPFMDTCRLSIAPLRYGAGVKGKVNMAMSYGLPVVATKCAVEGMHVRAGLDVLVAEHADDMAAKIVQAYGDEALWNTLSRNGLENVRSHFSFAAAREALLRILN